MERNTVVLDLKVYNDLLVNASKYELEKKQDKARKIVDNLHNEDGFTSTLTPFYAIVNDHKKELGQADTVGLTMEEIKELACDILKYYNNTFETNYDKCYADDVLLCERVYQPVKE